MKELIASVESLAKQYTSKNESITRSLANQIARVKKHCWICETEFADNDQVVIDHCHNTNKLLGWAHNECNINRKTANFIPVLAHNLSNYDLHFIVKTLSNTYPENTYSVIPSTEEKYISLTMSVYIKSYTDKNGKLKKVYENLRFIDSYKFMLSPFQNLSNTYRRKTFSYLKITLKNLVTQQNK